MQALPFDKPGQFFWGNIHTHSNLSDGAQPPSDVIAVNDLTALGAMECLQRRGIRVPEDVSVAGFDDSYLARYAAPPLTTVRLPAYEMGIAATEMAIAAVEGNSSIPGGREFPVELCRRASTGPTASSIERRMDVEGG